MGEKRERTPLTRRGFIKTSVAAGGVLLASNLIPLAACSANSRREEEPEENGGLTNTPSGEAATVYMLTEISPDSLLRIYDALGRSASGKVAVKLSTGEPGGNNYLKPALIGDLVRKVNGTIIECNTAYAGGRSDTEAHRKAAADHGFTAIAMGGFGGAIKNISIGIASASGKAWIHSAGKTRNAGEMWGNLPEQDIFLESMAEAAKAVVDHCGDNILYISVMNNLSVDCDCDSHPANPQMADIGILASLDPVALDKACVDMVYNSPDEGRSHLIERMESRHGIHTLEHAEAIGIGSQKYNLVRLDA